MRASVRFDFQKNACFQSLALDFSSIAFAIGTGP
jgi:hypothetical protein